VTTRTESEWMYRSYWDQAECLHKLIANVLEVTNDNSDFLTVIIHGDHGARITDGSDNATTDDLRMTYLAVRRPNSESTLVESRMALQPLVIEELKGFFRIKGTNDTPTGGRFCLHCQKEGSEIMTPFSMVVLCQL